MKKVYSFLAIFAFIVSSDAASDSRRLKRQAPVECIYTPAGGSWLNDCNWCRCSVRGRGICTKRGCPPGLSIRLEEETKQCQGEISWRRDCNWCDCVNGRAICTAKFCGDEPQAPQQQLIVEIPPEIAIPRIADEEPKKECNFLGRDSGRWRKKCNWCRCSETGGAICTRKACPEAFAALIKNDTECEGNVEWDKEGVWHKCVDGKVEACGTDFCEVSPRSVGVSKERDCSHVGTEGGRWRHECNWCRCSQSGLGLCTRRACPEALSLRLQNEPSCEGNVHWKRNGTWHKCVNGKAEKCMKEFCDEAKPNPVLDDVFGSLEATCSPISDDGGWAQECNWCRCIRGRSQCTRKACKPTVQVSDPSHIRDTVPTLESGPKCNGRVRWKQDCNWCECVEGVGICSVNICEKDVKEAVKEELACIAGAEGGSWRMDCNWCSCRNGVGLCTKKGCLPGAARGEPVCDGTLVWKEGCNWCRCKNGGVGVCTTRACGKEARTIEESTTCTEGQTWVEGCNTCFCGRGRSLCTRRACLEDLSQTGIEPASLRSQASSIADLENSKALESSDCIEGSRWKNDCNWCACAGGGVAVCTLKACLPSFELRSDEPVCEQGSEWKDACNVCSCLNGRAVCSKKLCKRSTTNVIEETSESEQQSEVSIPRGTSCKDGSRWRNDCNWCFCNNGYGGCTLIGCIPGRSDTRPECEGNSEWRRYDETGSCSWCKCVNEVAVCEPSQCSEEITDSTTVAKPALRARLIPSGAEPQEQEEPEVEKTCTDGSRWGVNCNWCTCANGVGACTIKGCLPGSEYKTEGLCEGNSSWKRDCNWCNCIDGKAVCTEKYCISEEKEEKQLCISGNSWVEDCNVCMCAKNVPVCTRRACLPQPKSAVESCQEGDSWKEDCNFCSCINGLSACTKMFCEPSQDPIPAVEPLPKVCSLPAIEANAQLCGGFEPKWTFNSEFEICEEIAYGGCGGTENLFNTEDECLTTCSRQQIVQTRAEIKDPMERCYLPQSMGPCFGSLTRYAFNPEINRCEMFYYGGCQGNQNNFVTLNECVNVCGGNPPIVEETCDRSKCNWSRFAHYLAKGCKPVYSGGHCCPTSFDCKSEDERGLSPNKCYYKGNEYQDGESIPVDHDCSAGCRCLDLGITGRVAEITCANIECPSLFMPPEPGCRQIYKLGKCCSVSKDCSTPVKDTRDAGCSWKDKSWKIGDKMYFDDEPCQKCVCSEDFTDPRGPGCEKINCGFDFRYRSRLVEGKTPIFFEDNCCPVDWLAPGDERLGEISAPDNSAVSSLEECTAGDLSVPVGASVTMTDCHIRCNCQTPPELTCVRYRSCELAERAANPPKKGIDCPALDCPAGCSTKFDTESGCPKCYCENMRFECPDPVCPPACLNPSVEFDEAKGCQVCKCECRTDARGEPHCPMDCKIRKFFDRESGCRKCECDSDSPHLYQIT